VDTNVIRGPGADRHDGAVLDDIAGERTALEGLE
jgi:hypothetical protein